jgi:endonuclease/exonuclease/phosphatase family metal-dependent hydrolase
MKLRVLSWNIHKCIGGVDRRYDPTRIVATLDHYAPDIAMLQEVDAGVARSLGHHQVDLLGELCAYPHRTWFPNVAVRGGGEYGNAILSRHPIVETRNIDLSVTWRKRRSVLHAICRIRHGDLDRTIHAFDMHLGLSGGERKIQIASFLASHPFRHLDGHTPVVVGGDLNDVWGGVRSLLLAGGLRGASHQPRTFPAWAPLRPLDSIYVRGDLELHHLHRGETDLSRRASDHRPLIADLEIHPHAPHHRGA